MSEYNIDYSGIPDHMRGGVKLYLEHGLRPGNFLMAVIQNKLAEAFARADITNRMAMFEWVKFLHNEMPSESWGSEEKVEAWIRKKKEESKESK